MYRTNRCGVTSKNWITSADTELVEDDTNTDPALGVTIVLRLIFTNGQNLDKRFRALTNSLCSITRTSVSAIHMHSCLNIQSCTEQVQIHIPDIRGRHHKTC